MARFDEAVFKPILEDIVNTKDSTGVINLFESMPIKSLMNRIFNLMQ